jgi:protein tyrosine phosphatase (PTP) superfamily phosphohydrolase (DUF442 family)
MKITNPIATIFKFFKLSISQYTPIDLVGNNLTDIFNLLPLSDRITTAGQPTTAQFTQVRNAGFNLVINLAPGTHENALPNEDRIVTSLGMEYIHIPIPFDRPTIEDFNRFCNVMQSHQDRSIFVHCAANFRVSSFMYLYRRIYENIDDVEAKQNLNKLWVPNSIWQEFIDRTLEGV